MAMQVWTRSTSLGLYTSITKKDSNIYLAFVHSFWSLQLPFSYSSIGLLFEDFLESNSRSVSQDFSFSDIRDGSKRFINTY